jgi:acetyl-CoA synthetase
VRRTFGKEVFDTWFQTETGAIMISNRPGLQVKPGSMGKPVSNISAEILGVGDVVLPPQTEGKLCLKTNWPSMFVTYLNNETAYSKKFSNDFYISGDVAYRDADGYFWFVGRDDDIINTAGHLVSPFEVESALLEIPEIAESGVIGVPDDLLFEKVIAYVCLRDDSNKSEEMEIKIRIYVSNKVSTLATPQEVIFVDKIPKNKSGKIMRRYLKSIYLGQDPGDISTMED